MSTTEIRLQEIEDGRILKQLVQWFRISHQTLPTQFNTLRTRTRRAARQAGITSRDIARLIAEVRSRRAC